MYTDETYFFVNAGNMGGNKLKKAFAQRVGSVKALLVGSSSAPRPPPSHPPSPPPARSGRRGSTRSRRWPTKTPSPLPAEEPDEDDAEYDQEVQSDSESESLASEDELLPEASEEGEEEDEEDDREEEGPGEDGFVLDPTLQWDPPEEWVETEEDIPEPRTRPPYQRGSAGLPDPRYYAYKNTLLPPVRKMYLL